MKIVRRLTWDMLLAKACAARLQARHNEALYVTLYAALRHILDLHAKDGDLCDVCDDRQWPCATVRIAQGAIDECRSSGCTEPSDRDLGVHVTVAGNIVDSETLLAEIRRNMENLQ